MKKQNFIPSIKNILNLMHKMKNLFRLTRAGYAKWPEENGAKRSFLTDISHIPSCAMSLGHAQRGERRAQRGLARARCAKARAPER